METKTFDTSKVQASLASDATGVVVGCYAAENPGDNFISVNEEGEIPQITASPGTGKVATLGEILNAMDEGYSVKLETIAADRLEKLIAELRTLERDRYEFMNYDDGVELVSRRD